MTDDMFFTFIQAQDAKSKDHLARHVETFQQKLTDLLRSCGQHVSERVGLDIQMKGIERQ